MKLEPKPAIQMEKQCGRTGKLGEVESLGISRASQTVLARLMESQIWHQFAGSVGGAFRKGTLASAHLDARNLPVYHWCLSSPVLELRGSESE